jgi:prevent-host-death family protein
MNGIDDRLTAMPLIEIHGAKADFDHLIARAEAGEEITITRGDLPVARLVPITRLAAPRTPGRLKGMIGIDERFWEALPEAEAGA